MMNRQFIFEAEPFNSDYEFDEFIDTSGEYGETFEFFEPDMDAGWHAEASSGSAPKIAAPSTRVLQNNIVKLANQEWLRWGKGTIQEHEERIREVLKDYWETGTRGIDYSKPNWWKRAWSAAFISWVMKKAGAGNAFKYSGEHAAYIKAAKDNRLANNANPFKAYRITEVQPRAGDLICKEREKSGANYDNITGGYKYKTHSDLVTEVHGDKLTVIGGNAKDQFSKKHNTVGKKIVYTSNGYLKPGKPGDQYFAVIQLSVSSNAASGGRQNPIASTPSIFSSIPQAVLDALSRGLESLALRLAIFWGRRDENKLTSLLFFFRHPERKGQKLTRGEPRFEQLQKEWRDIRDRLVRPALKQSQSAVSSVKAPTGTSATSGLSMQGKAGHCQKSPQQWAQSNLTKMTRWWKNTDMFGGKLIQLPVGAKLREMTPKVFPGVPVEVILGFCANGTVRENTTECKPNAPPNATCRRQKFHEIGLFGTEAGPRTGPAPNPNPKAEDNSWGKLANHPLVKSLLGGRSATMAPDGWKTAIADQVAVGLVNIREQGLKVVARLAPSIRPNVSASPSLFFIACCFMGWSAGYPRAAKHLNQFADVLANVPEEKRWGEFLRALADRAKSGRIDLRGLKKHQSVAYSALRTWQKLAAGQLLTNKTGGSIKWFDAGLGANEAAIADTITYAGNLAC